MSKQPFVVYSILWALTSTPTNMTTIAQTARVRQEKANRVLHHLVSTGKAVECVSETGEVCYTLAD